MTFVVGDLFSGIGGFAIATRWLGMEKAFFAEIEEYPSAVLAEHWPDVPNLGDLTQVNWARSVDEEIDCLAGGFPCQDISLAGKGEGIKGKRSGLWAEFRRAIAALRPRWVLIENVSQLRRRGLGVVLRDLAALGYDAEWHCVPATAVGAPHRRDRIWIVAYPVGITAATRGGYRQLVAPKDSTRDQGRGRDAGRRAPGDRGADDAGAVPRSSTRGRSSDVADADRTRSRDAGQGAAGSRERAGRDATGPGGDGEGRPWEGLRPFLEIALRWAQADVADAGDDRRLRSREPERTWDESPSGDLTDGRGARGRRNGSRRHAEETKDLGDAGPRRRGGRGAEPEHRESRPSGQARAEELAESRRARLPERARPEGQRASAATARGDASGRDEEALADAQARRRRGSGRASVGAGQSLREDERDDRARGATESGLGRGPDGVPGWLDLYRPEQGGIPSLWPAGPDDDQHDWEPPRVTPENRARRPRLTCIGNAIVPQVAWVFFQAMLWAEEDGWNTR